MNRYVQYVAPLIIAAGITAWLAVAAWRRRPAAGAVPFAALMAAVSLWSLGYSVELLVPDLASKILWAKIEYAGIVTVGVAWLLFALEYSGNEGWATPLRRALLATPPVLVLAMVWSNELHGLIWRTVELNVGGDIPVLDVSYGPGFWVHALYTYALLLVSTGLLLRMITRSAYLFRGQIGLLLLGMFAPWLGNIIYVLGFGPAVPLDLTPFAFTITGLCFGWSLLRSHLLDIVPVARDAVIERMSDGVVVLSAQNKIADINPAARAILGQPASALIGQPAGQVLHHWPELIERYRDVGEARAELQLDTPDGPMTYDMRITSIVNRRGEPNGRLIVLRDVSERKRAEKVLQQQNVYLMALHDTALKLINRLDVNTTLETVVARASQLLNAPNAFLFLDRPAEQALVGEVMTGRFNGQRGFHLRYDECVVGRVWSSGLAMAVNNYGEWEGRHPAIAALGLGSVVAIPLRANEQVVGVLGLAYNEPGHRLDDEELELFTRFGQLASLALDNAQLLASSQSLYDEQRKLADQLFQAKELAEAASRAKTDFISFVSHELRNPMTSMRGYVELMQMGAAGPLTREQMNMLGILYSNIAHMNTLVTDLIDTARIEAGRLKLEFETLSIVELLDAAILSAHGQLEAKEHMLNLKLAPDLPLVWADRVRVTQILQNLLSNANKYTPKGGSITVTAEQYAEPAERPMVHVAVQDTGIGIDEADQRRVFEQFFRANDEYARTVAGSGLGLAITRSLVELQGGRIWFQSKRHQGTTFHFTLPAASPSQLAARERPELAHA